jgi:hypothetical protein
MGVDTPLGIPGLIMLPGCRAAAWVDERLSPGTGGAGEVLFMFRFIPLKPLALRAEAECSAAGSGLDW